MRKENRIVTTRIVHPRKSFRQFRPGNEMNKKGFQSHSDGHRLFNHVDNGLIRRGLQIDMRSRQYPHPPIPCHPI